MTAVNMLDAKTNLSKYVQSITSGQESYVVIMRNGSPVAKIVPYEEDSHKRIGLAEGAIPYLCDVDEFNSIPVEGDFLGEGGV